MIIKPRHATARFHEQAFHRTPLLEAMNVCSAVVLACEPDDIHVFLHCNQKQKQNLTEQQLQQTDKHEAKNTTTSLPNVRDIRRRALVAFADLQGSWQITTTLKLGSCKCPCVLFVRVCCVPELL
jgi:hypothetical protein